MKKTKYNAKKIINKYGTFDSQTEYNRFLYLKSMENRGVIFELTKQVRFEIIPKIVKTKVVQQKTKTKEVQIVVERATHYTADFSYINSEGKTIIEEVKSKATKKARDYSLRRKLVLLSLSKLNKECGYEKYIFNEVCM